MAARDSIHSMLFQEFLRAAPQLAQQTGQLKALLEMKGHYRSLHSPLVVRKRLADHSSALTCQVDDAGAPVIGVAAALDKPPPLQPVDRRGDRAAGEKDLRSEYVDREGSLVQEGLQHSKIAQAHAQRFNAPVRMGFESSGSLP